MLVSGGIGASTFDFSLISLTSNFFFKLQIIICVVCLRGALLEFREIMTELCCHNYERFEISVASSDSSMHHIWSFGTDNVAIKMTEPSALYISCMCSAMLLLQEFS